VSFCVVLESHVCSNNFNKVCSKICPRWNWNSNAISCFAGIRIIISWNPVVLEVDTMHSLNQVIHCKVRLKNLNKSFLISVELAAITMYTEEIFGLIFVLIRVWWGIILGL